MKYKIKIDKGDYRDFQIYDAFSLLLCDPKRPENKSLYALSPAEQKLFDQDVFTFDAETQKSAKQASIVHSTTRVSPYIPGVLILANNQRHGLISRGKYLYKCIPDDRRIPEFLIPFKLKIGFNKNLHNKYIVFKFKLWDEKHPRGEIKQVIGDVEELVNFYEYQLYCKSLHSSIQSFNKAAREKLRGKNQEYYIQQIIEKYDLEDRSHLDIYTIDSEASRSFDDAFGIQIARGKDGEIKKYILSIYISNVPLWLDAMDLWDSFTERISTIYLPDKKRPMIPTILSDNLCSLKEKQLSAAFVLDVEYCVVREEIVAHRFSSATIRVNRNISHRKIREAVAAMDMLNGVGPATAMYKQTLELCKKINQKYPYMESINSSYDMIAYLMILTNYYTAKHLQGKKAGIFRAMSEGTIKENIDTLPPEITKFIKMWNSSGSNYIIYDQKNIKATDEKIPVNKFHHAFLDLDAYVHITSPIRRLVDLLNMIEMTKEKLENPTKANNATSSAEEFYQFWTSPEKMDYINRTMKAIRKIQNDCALLDLCVKNQELQKDIYRGYVFNRIIRTDGLFQYLVYLPKIKMVNRFTSSENLQLHAAYTFKLYLFLNEHKFKRKIKLEIIHDNNKDQNI